MKILVAEDDATSRLVIEATLKKAGHEVVTADNGLHAWTAWRETAFPAVISDWQMPDLDGLELCRAIRHTGNAQYTYFILLTAHGGKTNYLEAMEAGADDFLTKPLDVQQLLAKLHVAERILGLRQHVKRLEGLLSICAYCKKIRDHSQWQQMERYVTQHSEARFSHGICPDCFTKVKQEVGLT